MLTLAQRYPVFAVFEQALDARFTPPSSEKGSKKHSKKHSEKGKWMCDGNKGVQWNLSIEDESERARLVVNLEGKRYQAS